MDSTETLNVFISDTILDVMDKEKRTALVLMNFSKAFDSIEHSKLINKLRSLGVSKKGFSQCELVTYCQNLAWWKMVCLRALFSVHSYLIFTFPIFPPSQMFALLYLSSMTQSCICHLLSKNAEVAKTQLNNYLMRIAAWCCTFSLLLNPIKQNFYCMLGTPEMLQQMPENFNVVVLGGKIWPTSLDLGMILDTSLSYD